MPRNNSESHETVPKTMSFYSLEQNLMPALLQVNQGNRTALSPEVGHFCPTETRSLALRELSFPLDICPAESHKGGPANPIVADFFKDGGFSPRPCLLTPQPNRYLSLSCTLLYASF